MDIIFGLDCFLMWAISILNPNSQYTFKISVNKPQFSLIISNPHGFE